MSHDAVNKGKIKAVTQSNLWMTWKSSVKIYIVADLAKHPAKSYRARVAFVTKQGALQAWQQF